MVNTYTNTPVLSKVQIGGEIYYLKDADVRTLLDTYGSVVTYDVASGELSAAGDDELATVSQIKAYLEAQVAGLTGAMHFAGIVTVSEGLSEIEAIKAANPSPSAGDVVVISGSTAEYIYDGTEWREIGSESLYLTITSAETTYVPKTLTIAGVNLEDNITASELQTALDLGELAYKDSASTTLSDYATGITGVSYTPEGSVSVTVTNTATSIESTGSYTPAGTVSGTVTAAGTVSAPTVTVTPATSTVQSVSDVGTLASFSSTSGTFATSGITATIDADDSEMLVFSDASTGSAVATATYTAGTLPTLGTAQIVVSGITSATASAPTFTGSSTAITASFTGTLDDITVSGSYDKATSASGTFTGTADAITPTLTTGTKIITVE